MAIYSRKTIIFFFNQKTARSWLTPAILNQEPFINFNLPDCTVINPVLQSPMLVSMQGLVGRSLIYMLFSCGRSGGGKGVQFDYANIYLHHAEPSLRCWVDCSVIMNSEVDSQGECPQTPNNHSVTDIGIGHIIHGNNQTQIIITNKNIHIKMSHTMLWRFLWLSVGLPQRSCSFYLSLLSSCVRGLLGHR